MQYSLVRLGIFAIVFVALLFTPLDPIFCAVIAAVVGLCVAYIFFGKLRNAVAADLAQRRSGGASKDADAQAEDVDAA